MQYIDTDKSIFPIIKIDQTFSFAELLGTGFIVGPKPIMVTAKHIFKNNQLKQTEKYAIISKGKNKNILIHRIDKIGASTKYDVAYFEVDYLVKEVDLVKLDLCPDFDSSNHGIVTTEYSESLLMPKRNAGLKINIIRNTRKGNAVRFYTSEFPEKNPVYCFDTSYPALQGASGAPVILEKNLSVVGMLVTNIERHLIPAQTIKIKEGKKYTEETKYFLPIGKAIHSRVIIDVLQKARYEISISKFYE